jgi:hypothetical protein
MNDPVELEEKFQIYIGDLAKYAPDGVLEVDTQTLEELDVTENTSIKEEDPHSHSFYVIESEEKLTLFNDKYLVWIVPQVEGDSTKTFTLIALNTPKIQPLELVFTTSGVYNQSGLVLQLLEKYLEQISENQKLMDTLGNL